MKKINKKKGFTLVELLGVILIISVLALIIMPLIIKSMKESKKKLTEAQIKLIYSASDTYIKKYKNEYPNIVSNKYCITIQKLVNEGLLDEKLKNYIDNSEVELETSIEVNVDSKISYSYELKYDRISCSVDMAKAPILAKQNQWVVGLDLTKIERIEFVNVASFPEGSIDVSDKKNGKVKRWIKDEDDNGMLEVYIGAVNDVVYANPDSWGVFSAIKSVRTIKLYNFDTSLVTRMNNMFNDAGSSAASLEIDFGNRFDTSNVTDMSYMFSNTGRSSPNFTLNLGTKFDTNSVINMKSMFSNTGMISPNFTLNLGTKFDTSNVTDMESMFQRSGSNSLKYVLDLGDKFNTSKVTNMNSMFSSVGYYSPNFKLNLGNKFDLSSLKSSYHMFSSVCANCENYTLYLKTTNLNADVSLSGMFLGLGSQSKNFTLNLSEFDTSKVTNMSAMFSGAGNGVVAENFTLILGNRFDTSKVTNMNSMFNEVGMYDKNFSLYLGNNFNVDLVVELSNTFYRTGMSIPGFKPTAKVKTQAEKDAIISKFPNIDVAIKP